MSRLDAALGYAGKGWPVFPLVGKVPAIGGGGGVHDATTDEQTIRQHWGREDFNIGVACGVESGVWVLDIDGDTGEESLAELEREHSELPPTVESHTGRGRHLFFRHNGGAIANKVAIRPGLDVRATGGYVVAPPSFHKDAGREYCWSVDGDPDDMEPVDPPPWLLGLVTEPKPNGSANDIAAPEILTDSYGATALAGEAETVANAPIGKQEYTLNTAALKIGGLVGSGHIKYQLALDTLVAAGLQMVCDPQRKPWTEAQLRTKVERALKDGAKTPREPEGDKPDEDTARPPQRFPVLTIARDFTDGFQAPNFLIEDTAQRRSCNSLVGRTGDGKTAVMTTAAIHVAAGLPFAGRHVEQGAVAFFAGENADDVRARTIMTAEHFDVSLGDLPLYFFDRPFDIMKAKTEIEQQVEAIGGVALIIIDTAAAFFQGDDENSNVQLGNFARDMRTLCELPGGPCVIIACHPTKSASKSSLVPRGGGAFVAEVDANLRVWSDDAETTELHWCEKIRGPGFEPITFRLERKTSECVKDSKGRLIPSVVAVPMGEDELKDVAKETRSNEDALLDQMLQLPNGSIADWATNLAWLTPANTPQKSKVSRALDRLSADKLASKYRGRWVLTERGRKEAEKLL